MIGRAPSIEYTQLYEILRASSNIFSYVATSGDAEYVAQFHSHLSLFWNKNNRRTRTLHRVFRAFDRELSGSVDYHEFCDFLLHGAVGKPPGWPSRRRSNKWNTDSGLSNGKIGRRHFGLSRDGDAGETR